MHEAPGDDQQVVIENVELVQQGQRGVGERDDKQRRLVRRERVERGSASAVGDASPAPRSAAARVQARVRLRQA